MILILTRLQRGRFDKNCMRSCNKGLKIFLFTAPGSWSRELHLCEGLQWRGAGVHLLWGEDGGLSWQHQDQGHGEGALQDLSGGEVKVATMTDHSYTWHFVFSLSDLPRIPSSVKVHSRQLLRSRAMASETLRVIGAGSGAEETEERPTLIEIDWEKHEKRWTWDEQVPREKEHYLCLSEISEIN